MSPIIALGGTYVSARSPSSRDPFTGRHTGRPLQNVHQPPKTGRGQSPAPTVDECRFEIYQAIPNLVSRKVKCLE